MLILVRHAEPDASPDVPPTAWVLSERGRAAAAALVRTLPHGVSLVSSAEPKAWQTLGGTDAVTRDPRFGEVDRPLEPWSDDFRSARSAYVAGKRHPGWEAHADVVARFQAGVDAALPTDGSAVAIASHGMALTTWLVGVGVLPPDEAAAFWADLRFPDAHAVDLAAREVRRYNGSA